jgi:hypothetical protein
VIITIVFGVRQAVAADYGQALSFFVDYKKIRQKIFA